MSLLRKDIIKQHKNSNSFCDSIVLFISSLQQVLMTLQQAQLDCLAEWLSTMEKKIEDFGSLGNDVNSTRASIEKHKALQLELEQQQDEVNSLQHMVVVIDEASNDNGKLVIVSQQ